MITTDSHLSHRQLIVAWICQVVAALIMLQTLFFKFTAAEESVSGTGNEPCGTAFAAGATAGVEITRGGDDLSRIAALSSALLARSSIDCKTSL